MHFKLHFLDKDNEEPIVNDWSSYTPVQLKQKKSEKLKIPNNKSTIQDKISTWALCKADLVELQKKAFEEEHKLKCAQMREKHQLFIELQKEEWELKKQNMIEIHQQTLKKLL